MLGGLLGGGRNIDLGREIAAIKADLGDVVDRVSRVTDVASGQIRNGVSSLSDAKDRFSGAAQGLLGQGRDWFNVAEGELTNGMKQARATVERNPMVGIAIAAGIGFLLGLSSRRRD